MPHPNSASNTGRKKDLKAKVDFKCVEAGCDGLICMTLLDAAEPDFQAVCPSCHRPYQFDDGITEKLRKLRELIVAIRRSESILGDCKVAVTVPGGTVKIPYPLLLTRLNTIVTLDLQGRKVDFHFMVEPSSSETFR